MTELSPENQLARRDDRKKSLELAGIPSAYHETKLLQVVGGTPVENWLFDEDGLRQVFNGRCLNIEGIGANATALFYTTAKAIHLLGCGVYVTSVTKLARMMNDNDEFEWANRCRCVAVFNFQGELFDSPLTPSQRYDVEDYLVERLCMDNPLLVLCRKPVTKTDPGWWTPSFVDQLLTKTQTFGVPR